MTDLIGGSCREGLKNPPPPPKSRVALAQKTATELEKTRVSGKDGFSRVIQPTSGRSVLNALDTLFPETRKKTVLTTSQLDASGVDSTRRIFKPPGRGTKTELRFSDDEIKESATARGPSTLEMINNIRSPSPDFDFDDMDDLIRAAPASALDADTFAIARGSTAHDAEVVSSPPDFPHASRKRSRNSPPGYDSTAKRTKTISDWQGDIGRRRHRPTGSDSVQEVGAFSMDAVLGRFLTWGCCVGFQPNLQVSFSASVLSWKQ